jgi:AAA family ATP:ADP antiporter
MQNRDSWSERFLRLFSDVRTGEGATVMLLALNVFLILAAYYFMKPVREALILVGGGAEVKSYSSAGQAILLLAAVPAYGMLASRMPRRRLINIVTFFFITCLGFFYGAARLGVAPLPLAIAYYLYVGIFNGMVIAQFWAFANDLYTTSEGERLFPVVAVGASAGGVFGALAAAPIIESFGVLEPMLVAAVLLVLSVLVTNYVDARERRKKEAGLPGMFTTGTMPAATGGIRVEDIRRALEEPEGEEPEQGKGPDLDLQTLTETLGKRGPNPFAMVLRCRYLLLIALLMLVLNWVNSTGEYILSSIVTDTAADAVASGAVGDLDEGQYIGAFYAQFFGVVNVLGLLIQALLVARVVKLLGVAGALLVLPIIALGVYAIIFLAPVLMYARWAKTVENATDYSLQNTVRNMLFLPCTREQKYKAKQAIDTFFVRAGDVLSAAVIFLGTTFLAARVTDFALFNILLLVGWLVLAVLIGREYKALVATNRPPCN